MTELPACTVAQVQAALRKGDVSPREVLQALEVRIARLDPQIGAYLSRDFETALAEAERADLTLPLGGVPFAVKDLISVANQPCTCASLSLQNYRSPYSATVIQRLRAAGAIPFGRTNMDEFAMGSSTENSSLQTTRNPWDLARVPGGSSGGSAAAVAADLAFAGLGTDTGGSVRQPAAFCGVVGMKPTYGRVSRYGVTAFASSLDQVGPLTKTVRDAALLLNALAGADPNDSTCLAEPVPDYTSLLGREIRGLRLGLPKEFIVAGIDPSIRTIVDDAVRHFTQLGAEVSEVSLPHTEHGVATYNLLAAAEASANLARFDGVRYGHRAKDISNLAEHYRRTRAEGFGPEVKRRIILGTYVLSAGYYDNYYLQAQKVRALIRRDFTRAFQNVDVLLTPTTPTPAFRLGEKSEDPLQMYLADIFTNTANLAGICGISLPGGFVHSPEDRPLPIGLQLLGPPLDEGRLLQVAYAYEQSTSWHTIRPQLEMAEA